MGTKGSLMAVSAKDLEVTRTPPVSSLKSSAATGARGGIPRRRIIDTLWRRKIQIVLAMIVALAGAAIYLARQAPLFDATAEVQLASAPLGSSPSKASGDITSPALVTSQQVTRVAAAKLGGMVGKKVSASRSGTTDVLSIVGQAPTPVEAQAVANVFANSYVAYRSGEINSQITALHLQASMAQARVRQLQGQVAHAPKASLPLLQAQSNAAARSFTALSAQVLSAEAAANPATVLQAAGPATSTHAGKSKVLSLAALLGLIAGVGVALVRERLDKRFPAPVDLDAVGNAPLPVEPSAVPGAVREMSAESVLAQRGRRRYVEVDRADIAPVEQRRGRWRPVEPTRVEIVSAEPAGVSQVPAGMASPEPCPDVPDAVDELASDEAIRIVRASVEVAAAGVPSGGPLGQVVSDSRTSPDFYAGSVASCGSGAWPATGPVTIDGAPVLARLPTDDRSADGRWPVIADDGSVFADAIQDLRAAVQAQVADVQCPVVVVTSPESGDGRTVVVASLAAACAARGKRTVVISGDLRRPRLEAMFALPSELPGLSSMVEGEAAGRAVEEMLVATTVPGLWILPAGPPIADPAGVLASWEVEGMIARLRALADMVLVDSPPGRTVADATVLGAYADGAIVVATRHTTREVLDQTTTKLAAGGVRTLGLALNHSSRGADQSSRTSLNAAAVDGPAANGPVANGPAANGPTADGVAASNGAGADNTAAANSSRFGQITILVKAR